MELERKTVTIEEAGQILGVGRSKMYSLARSGEIPVLKLGPRLWRVPLAALDKFMEHAGAEASV